MLLRAGVHAHADDKTCSSSSFDEASSIHEAELREREREEASARTANALPSASSATGVALRVLEMANSANVLGEHSSVSSRRSDMGGVAPLFHGLRSAHVLVRLWLDLSRVYLQSKCFDEARECVGEAEALCGPTADVCVAHALVDMAKRRVADALASLQSALALVPDHYQALLLLATVEYERECATHKASTPMPSRLIVSSASMSPRTNGFSGAVHADELDSLVNDERPSPSPLVLSLLECAVRARPDSAHAWHQLGSMLLAAKEFDRANEALAVAVRLESNSNALGLGYWLRQSVTAMLT